MYYIFRCVAWHLAEVLHRKLKYGNIYPPIPDPIPENPISKIKKTEISKIQKTNFFESLSEFIKLLPKIFFPKKTAEYTNAEARNKGRSNKILDPS